MRIQDPDSFLPDGLRIRIHILLDGFYFYLTVSNPDLFLLDGFRIRFQIDTWSYFHNVKIVSVLS